MTENIALHEYLQNVRRQALYSQREFAQYFGVCKATYNRWERGVTRMPTHNLRKLREFCRQAQIEFPEDIPNGWFS